MACRSCSAGLGRLPKRIAAPLRQNILDVTPIPASSRCAISTTSSASTLPFATIPAITPRRTPRTTRRALHTTSPQQKFNLKEMLFNRVRESMATGNNTYYIYKVTEDLYKACAAQADYAIAAADRKAGTLKTTEDGEEIGTSKAGTWHNELGLLPTFSTWAQVSMLHMYLLVVRLRCLEPAAQQAWQSQLVNHFFYQAEAKMEDVHDLSSRMIRQTYLKDLFVQWRGLILAYDEGIVKGDAVLASAVWRNLFKAREDVDVRALAAVVAWMRSGLKNLGQLADDDLPSALKVVPGLKVQSAVVDVPTASMRTAFTQAGILSS
ncbi:ubiquinol-cytochrome C chaperone-domain-containing protein [Chaetomium sp. MPI-CAGE-AT-0009]|nr:ubiquinol-cytochrome C chaperone-domain-containing protein [Chaetomium sp. MPI-CAGE-AT-0009]